MTLQGITLTSIKDRTKKTFPAKKSVFLVFKEAYRAIKL